MNESDKTSRTALVVAPSCSMLTAKIFYTWRELSGLVRNKCSTAVVPAASRNHFIAALSPSSIIGIHLATYHHYKADNKLLHNGLPQ